MMTNIILLPNTHQSQIKVIKLKSKAGEDGALLHQRSLEKTLVCINKRSHDLLEGEEVRSKRAAHCEDFIKLVGFNLSVELLNLPTFIVRVSG